MEYLLTQNNVPGLIVEWKERLVDSWIWEYHKTF